MAMKEYNIEALWKEDIVPESQFSLGYLPNAIKSKLHIFSELKRIRNLFWWEWLGEFIAIILAVIYLTKSDEPFSFKDLVINIIYSVAVYYFYISYFINFIKGINTVPSLKIKGAIQSYYNTLVDYINRVYRLAIVLLGISTVSMLFDFLLTSEVTLGSTIDEIFTLLLSFGISYAIIDGYYDYMYKDSKTEFEILLRELEEE